MSAAGIPLGSASGDLSEVKSDPFVRAGEVTTVTAREVTSLGEVTTVTTGEVITAGDVTTVTASEVSTVTTVNRITGELMLRVRQSRIQGDSWRDNRNCRLLQERPEPFGKARYGLDQLCPDKSRAWDGIPEISAYGCPKPNFSGVAA
jgi:hypothetical protein